MEIVIVIFVTDVTQARPEDLYDFTNAAQTWFREYGQAGMSPKMQQAWLSNYTGLMTASQSKAKGDYLVSVHDPLTKKRHFLAKVAKRGITLDISEVIGDPIRQRALDEDSRAVLEFLDSSPGGRQTLTKRAEAAPLACFFSWAANNANIVTLTANTVGLIKLYEQFGFEMNGGGPSATLPLKRLAKFAGYVRYVTGLVKGNGEWIEETSEQLGAEYEGRGKTALQLVEELRTPQGAAVMLKLVEASLDDAKFAQINKQMTLSAGGAEYLTTTFLELVHWRGDKL
jgi:hypothetical protein